MVVIIDGFVEVEKILPESCDCFYYTLKKGFNPNLKKTYKILLFKHKMLLILIDLKMC